MLLNWCLFQSTKSGRGAAEWRTVQNKRTNNKMQNSICKVTLLGLWKLSVRKPLEIKQDVWILEEGIIVVVVVLMIDLNFWSKLNNREPTTTGMVGLLEVVAFGRLWKFGWLPRSRSAKSGAKIAKHTSHCQQLCPPTILDTWNTHGIQTNNSVKNTNPQNC